MDEEFEEFEEESKPAESFDSSKIELVDLIEKPDWKTILIDLVKTEKMDPWNIDITALADKYLKKINALGGKDLRLPANAILASAILLRFKARVLKFTPFDDDEERSEKQAGELTPEQKLEIEALLPELRVIKSSREGKVSLDDLVQSIEKMLEKHKGGFDKRPFGEKEIIEFKLPGLDYDVESHLDEVFNVIQSKADSQGFLVFSRLVESKKPFEVINYFLACLFLSNKNKINVWQEEFFGEIFISINSGQGQLKP